MKEMIKTIDDRIVDESESLPARLHQYFKRNPRQPSPAGSSKIMIKTSDNEAIGQQIQAMRLDKNQDLIAFFNSMSAQEAGFGTKNARLDRDQLKNLLVRRYSSIIAERMLAFVETHYTTFYKADCSTYVKIISDLLQGGPELYKKLLFACMSQSNSGQICEHDIFSTMEQFKQRDSCFFYQELIEMTDIPRDYKIARD